MTFIPSGSGVTLLSPELRPAWAFTQEDLRVRFLAMIGAQTFSGTLLDHPDLGWLWSPLTGWASVRDGFEANLNFVLRLGYTTTTSLGFTRPQVTFHPPTGVSREDWVQFMTRVLPFRTARAGVYVAPAVTWPVQTELVDT